MPAIVLQPCASAASKKNYARTIARPVPFAPMAHLLGPEGQVLAAAHPDGAAAMWGTVPHRDALKDHDRLSPGDIVLFGGQGYFFQRGTVTARWRNRRLAQELWESRGDGQTWELMYALGDLEDIEVPYAELNELWGYAPTASPRSFRLLDQERSNAARAYLGSGKGPTRTYVPAEAAEGATNLLRRLIGTPLTTVSGRTNTIISVRPPNVIVATKRSPAGQPVPIDWVDKALAQLLCDGRIEIHPGASSYRSAFIGAVLTTLPGAFVAGSPPTITLRAPGETTEPSGGGFTYQGDLSRDGSSAQRGEQGPLRGRLFGSAAEAPCAICGNTYPVRFLWAAHIKKRAICSADERRDLDNIAMAACLFGCDALYEAGYVSVGEDGHLVVAAEPGPYPELLQRLINLHGRRVTAHTPASADYFRWHRENIYRHYRG